MPDRTAERFVDNFFGAMPGRPPEPPHVQVRQYRSLNQDGWMRIVRRVGVEGAKQYHDTMERLAKEHGL